MHFTLCLYLTRSQILRIFKNYVWPYLYVTVKPHPTNFRFKCEQDHERPWQKCALYIRHNELLH